METPETGGDWGRLGETSGDSRDWWRPVETPETLRDQWRLQRLQRLGETSGDSSMEAEKGTASSLEFGAWSLALGV